MRTSLKSLRSLLVSIHPPDLHADGLAAALTDLTAPAAAAQIETTVHVSTTSARCPTTPCALVWRVAQEAVRNAIRHADAPTLEVDVHRQRRPAGAAGGRRRSSASTPDGDRDPASFGLRGLASLVADEGGRLDVRSTPGEGTDGADGGGDGRR